MKLETVFKKTAALLTPLEARLLMQKVYELTKQDFIVAGDKEIEEEKLTPFLTRRINHEPMAYILGEQEFYGLNFKVSPATLIPRPDSECVVDAALHFLKEVHAPSILDLGTGTGALLISLLTLTQGWGIGVDYAQDALKIAKENALLHKVNALFMNGDWASALKTQFDLIISNPPYIETKTIDLLQKDVRLFEPHLALDGGEKGLDCYKIILSQTHTLLKPHGHLVLEIGQGQEEAIIALAKTQGFTHLALDKDLSGIVRALTFKALIN